MQALVQVTKSGKFGRFEAGPALAPWSARDLAEQKRLWRFWYGVADFYMAAARTVIAQLGDPRRI
ncbi:MAG TPA: hypothetical protein VMI54_20595 [Polyangiaceae bacterium]|nr:hypothetical protein [Polyangiaceae bacterium]